MKITIECEQIHLHMLRDACEMYFRIALGQFREICKEHIKNLEGTTTLSWWDIEQEVEKKVRPILTPDLHHTGSNYGVGNKKVSTNSHICYELWKVLGGGTSGPPLNYSGVKTPKVTIEDGEPEKPVEEKPKTSRRAKKGKP